MIDRWHVPQPSWQGGRYLHEGLPPEVAARLTRLAYVADASELPARVEEATAWFQEITGSL